MSFSVGTASTSKEIAPELSAERREDDKSGSFPDGVSDNQRDKLKPAQVKVKESLKARKETLLEEKTSSTLKESIADLTSEGEDVNSGRVKNQPIGGHLPQKNKVYCICKTKYDATKFYVGCDLCLNWFHGSCIGITEKMSRGMTEYVCDECSSAKESENFNCLCKQPYDKSQFYIGCDNCHDWFHGRCVGILQAEVDEIEEYICPRCEPKNKQTNIATEHANSTITEAKQSTSTQINSIINPSTSTVPDSRISSSSTQVHSPLPETDPALPPASITVTAQLVQTHKGSRILLQGLEGFQLEQQQMMTISKIVKQKLLAEQALARQRGQVPPTKATVPLPAEIQPIRITKSVQPQQQTSQLDKVSHQPKKVPLCQLQQPGVQQNSVPGTSTDPSSIHLQQQIESSSSSHEVLQDKSLKQDKLHKSPFLKTDPMIVNPMGNNMAINRDKIEKLNKEIKDGEKRCEENVIGMKRKRKDLNQKQTLEMKKLVKKHQDEKTDLEKMFTREDQIEHRNIALLKERREELAKDLQKITDDPGKETSNEDQDGLEAAKRYLECPICLELMCPPTKIWMCRFTHLLCELCKVRLDRGKCPTCTAECVTLRAFMAENFALTIFKK